MERLPRVELAESRALGLHIGLEGCSGDGEDSGSDCTTGMIFFFRDIAWLYEGRLESSGRVWWLVKLAIEVLSSIWSLLL